MGLCVLNTSSRVPIRPVLDHWGGGGGRSRPWQSLPHYPAKLETISRQGGAWSEIG